MNAILEVRSLSRAYGNTLALDAVDLQVAPGEFIALLGPSGCGKTTLLRCVGGFIEPTGGQILIDGQAMVGVPPYRRPVNTVFQSYALFPHLTIEDNVAYGPRRAGVDGKEIPGRVQQALEMVGLSQMASRYPGQLSGGQQQRIALARAIVNRPRLLLLDEPLGALDLKLRRQMQIELKKLQKQLGIAFVFVTHDQEEALVMADRVAVMNNGRIEQIGTGEEIYNSPASAFVADFIGEANLIETEVVSGRLLLAGGGQTIATGIEKPPGKYKLLARPEKLRPAGSGTSCVQLDATVTRAIFVGDSVRIFLQLANGAEIAMKQASGEPFAATAQPGVAVRIELCEPVPRLLA